MYMMAATALSLITKALRAANVILVDWDKLVVCTLKGEKKKGNKEGRGKKGRTKNMGAFKKHDVGWEKW